MTTSRNPIILHKNLEDVMAILSKKNEITPGVQLFDFKILRLDRHLDNLVEDLRQLRRASDRQSESNSDSGAESQPKDV